MKKQIVRMMMVILTGAALAIIVGVTVIVPAVVHAAPNTATGDIAGVAADLGDSPAFNLNTTTLALVKKAFLASDGSPLNDNASVPRGTLVKFLIYINNNTAVPVNDVSVRDVLDATFAYVPGTLKVDNSVGSCAVAVCTAGEEASIFGSVDAAAAFTDAAGDDVVSFDGSNTIDAGNQNEVTNNQLDISASSVWAISFTVTMQ